MESALEITFIIVIIVYYYFCFRIIIGLFIIYIESWSFAVSEM